MKTMLVFLIVALWLPFGCFAGPEDVLKALQTKTVLLKYMYWEKPNEPACFYRDGGDNVDVEVILLHGRGKHPRWMVVEPLSEGIWKELSYHCVSLHGP